MLIQTLIVSCALQVAQSAADNEPFVVCAENGLLIFNWQPFISDIYLFSDGKHTAIVM